MASAILAKHTQIHLATEQKSSTPETIIHRNVDIFVVELIVMARRLILIKTKEKNNDSKYTREESATGGLLD